MGIRDQQRGFTLGEILATMAVVGASLALAVPSLQSMTGSNRRATSVNQLVATMQLARSEAVMRNRRVTVCASTDGENCSERPWEQGWIAFIDEDANGRRDAAESIIDRVNGLTGFELDSGQFAQAFSYRPDGRAMGAAPEINTAEFAFCEPGAEIAARVVIVRSNGLPYVSDKSRDGRATACRSS